MRLFILSNIEIYRVAKYQFLNGHGNSKQIFYDHFSTAGVNCNQDPSYFGQIANIVAFRVNTPPFGNWEMVKCRHCNFVHFGANLKPTVRGQLKNKTCLFPPLSTPFPEEGRVVITVSW
jgi:hypothetical protein